ncbi:hypothetical protein GWI33_017566 [Rhynchophorus ferrugineus]|uniref:Uncharacterized protein n=1 Tax=Rhynchophorus ferrugineus TaxID=354439 RepID=A0A834M634_RHYFE|nr:hypothetical protein GWI33_017566 [Rhynchophorus ferrugineus]
MLRRITFPWSEERGARGSRLSTGECRCRHGLRHGVKAAGIFANERKKRSLRKVHCTMAEERCKMQLRYAKWNRTPVKLAGSA